MLWKIVEDRPGNKPNKFVRYFSGTREEAFELVKPAPKLIPVPCSLDETRLYYAERKTDSLYQMIGAIMAVDMPEAAKKRLTEVFHTYEVEIDKLRAYCSADVVELLTEINPERV